MNEKMFLRPYCLIGIGDNEEIEEIKKDLSFIAEPKANFVTGENLIIATFKTSLFLRELEEFLNMHERTFIIFEMVNSMFFANLQNKEFQQALFGNEFESLMDINKNPFTDYTPKISEGIKEFLKQIKDELTEEEYFSPYTESKDPTIDEILDRINVVGLDNLTEKEKEILDNNSNNK